MANVNAPFGLRPVRYMDGRPYNGAVTYGFATGATGVIAIGDPVVLAGAANTTEIMGMYPPGTLPTVTLAADGDADPIFGVCVGVVPTSRDSTPYRVDSTDRVIMIANGPDLVFWGQTDAASTDWAGTDVGSYANMKAGTASTITGKSAWFLDTTDGPDNADPSNQLLVLGLANIPGNAIGDYSIWEVLINNHQLANVADGGRFTGV